MKTGRGERTSLGKKKPLVNRAPSPPLTESERYAHVSIGKMDPTYPATKRLLAVMSEIREEYIRTHTMDDIIAMRARIEEERRIRERLFAGRVRPVVEWERQERWIEEFGLSPVLGYELDDPC